MQWVVDEVWGLGVSVSGTIRLKVNEILVSEQVGSEEMECSHCSC